MGLIKGQVVDIVAIAGGSADAAGKIFGFSIKDIKDMLEVWRDIMKMRQGTNFQEPAPPPPAINPPPLRVHSAGQAPAPSAPLPESKADKALVDIANALKFIVDNGGGDIKLYDALQQSGITVKTVYETIQKALK